MPNDKRGRPTRLARSRAELWRTYFSFISMCAALASLGILMAHYVFGAWQ